MATSTEPGLSSLEAQDLVVSDLRVIIETIHQQHSSGLQEQFKQLKVVEGTVTYEQVSLNELVQQAATDIRPLSLIASENLDRKLVIVVESPKVAIRYRLSDGQTRRVQFQFAQASDCGRVLDIFTRMSLPFKHKTGDSQPFKSRPEPATSSNFITAPVTQYQSYAPFLYGPPSTASSAFTFQSHNTANTVSTANTDSTIHAHRSLVYPPSNGSFAGFDRHRQHHEASYQSHPDQLRLLPRSTATTTVIPGPSIPESIISTPSRQPRDFIDRNNGPSSFQSLPNSLFANTPHGSPSHLTDNELIQQGRPEIARHAALSASHDVFPWNNMTQSEQLNQTPPPKRKLPFPEPSPSKAKKSTGRGGSHAAEQKALTAEAKESQIAKDGKTKAGTKPKATARKTASKSQGENTKSSRDSKSQGAKFRSQPTHDVTKTSTSKLDSEPTPSSSKPVTKQAKNTRKDEIKTQVADTLPKTRSRAAQQTRPSAPRRQPPRKAAPKSKVDREPVRKNDEAAKTNVRSKLAAAKPTTSQIVSTAVRTNGNTGSGAQHSATKATQTERPRTRSGVVYSSSSTQTATVLAIPRTIRSRAALAGLSPNIQSSIESQQKPTSALTRVPATPAPKKLTVSLPSSLDLQNNMTPSTTDAPIPESPLARKAPPVNKFTKPPPRHVNKFRRDPSRVT